MSGEASGLASAAVLYRITLAAALTDAGRAEEAAASYTCECGLVRPASDFIDVRDRGDLFRTPFVCRDCRPILDRQETYEREQAALAAALGPAAQALMAVESRCTDLYVLARPDPAQTGPGQELRSVPVMR